MNKFKNLMNTYNIMKYTNFIHDSCFLIDLIDYTNQKNSIDFLDNIIIKKIDSNEIKTNICFKLLSYPNLSINLNSFIILYFIKNNNKLDNKIESLIRLKLNDKNYKEIIKSIIDEINRLIIKEEDLFNEEENIEFFFLLKRIQKYINFQKIDNQSYINNIINLKNSIINNLKNGNIQYKLIHLWLNDNEKKKILIERLEIISFQNKNEINDCLNSLENYFSQINETVKYIKRLNEILKVFFWKEQQTNIVILDNYENFLKEGFLNEVNKSSNIKKIDKSNFIKDLDLDEMDKLKSSNIFLYFFNNKKTNDLCITDGITKFKNAKKDFNKLRLLFYDNWEEPNLIEEFSNIFKTLIKNENELEKELLILKEYFNIENQDIYRIKNDLIFLINKKEEILKDLNYSFNFILKLSPKNIQLSDNLNNLKDNIYKNINLNLVKNYDNLFNEFFTNLSKKNQNKKKIGINEKYNFRNNENNNNLKVEKENNKSIIDELKAEKEKNKSLINKIKTLEFKIIENQYNNDENYNNRQFMSMKPGEKIISIMFSSVDQKVNRCFACKNTDIFIDVEKKLYDNYPEYKEFETYFIFDGNKIKRFKTMEENKIIDGTNIMLNKFDDIINLI